MPPPFDQRVRELFNEALERPAAERAFFLRRECAGDAPLLEEVERLLHASADAGSFLNTAPRPTRQIGRYLIRGEIGRGGMGIVYDAVDPLIGRSVAVKVIHLKALSEPTDAELLRDRLFREARSCGQLSHPGIVVIFDVGHEEQSAFIAMEKVDGPSLRKRLDAGARFSVQETLGILQQIAAALDYAHYSGVVHRDIKPANVMLRDDGVVKVADFGIAKVISRHRTTVTGVLLGTPSYMSPEQIDGREIDGRSDQFSLAVLAFELLAGERPFQADSFASIAHLIVYGERPSAAALNAALPAAVDAVFRRALARLPEDRFRNCLEFTAALQKAVDAPPASHAETRKVVVERRAPNRFAAFAKAFAIAALPLAVAALAFFFYSNAHFAAETPLPSITVPPPQPPAPVQFHPAPPTQPVASAPLPPEPAPVPSSVRAAQWLADGLAKRRAGQLADAASLFTRAAELGDANAMVELGESYSSGDGVPQDEAKAMSWFRRAAEAGNPSGMVSLAGMYLLGVAGAEPDEASAARWFQKAADRNNPAALFDLATLYETGRGVPRNPAIARNLYQRAAALGNFEAQKRLAQLASHR